jgi:hypothetical protein
LIDCDPALTAKTKTRRGWGTQIIGMGEIVKNDKGLFLQISHLRRDRTAPKVGHPDSCLSNALDLDGRLALVPAAGDEAAVLQPVEDA